MKRTGTLNGIYKVRDDGTKFLNPRIVFLLAAACGITVANLY